MEFDEDRAWYLYALEEVDHLDGNAPFPWRQRRRSLVASGQ